MFIISSDTSCYYLQCSGVIPDLIVSVDSGRGTGFHFREDFSKEIPILTWLGGNRKIFELENPLLLYLSTHPLDQLLRELFFPDTVNISNPSLNIAGLAKELAIFLGEKEIFFAGMGMLKEEGKTHCRGTGYELYKLNSITRKSTLENYSPVAYSAKMSGKNKLAFDELNKTDRIDVKYLDTEMKLNAQEKLPILNFAKTNISSSIVKKTMANPVIAGKIADAIGVSPGNLKKYIKLLGSGA